MLVLSELPGCTRKSIKIGFMGNNSLKNKEFNPKKVGIIGLGYVGLPLACLFAEKQFQVTGYDIDPEKAKRIRQGRSYIGHIPNRRLHPLVKSGFLSATHDFTSLAEQDCIIACVPTPLNKYRQPDLTYVCATAEIIGSHLKRGQLIVFESTTYPGTNKEIIEPILEKSGLKAGKDFFLAYSPEREDPGNKEFSTASIPKIVGADHPKARWMALRLYGKIIQQTVAVRNAATAEAVKLTENVFRAVNIALVNELKVIYESMGIDIWEVIEAAKTKPFGFMPFYPGPGWGGHCIPIDPFYLTWKAREFGHHTRFIELAGEINTQMPHRVVARLAEALSLRKKKSLKGAKILLIGLAYKKNVDDMRESPALVVWEELEHGEAHVQYHDPLIPTVKPSREHPELKGRKSRALTKTLLRQADAVLIVTDHDQVDYNLIAKEADLVIDTRNVMARMGLRGRSIVKA
jgi:UDP-N-acetyl-D-glucosamine dehydrogenase